MRHLAKYRDVCNWLSNGPGRRAGPTSPYTHDTETREASVASVKERSLEGPDIGMLPVLFFQLSRGFEIFHQKKVRRKKKNPALFHLVSILVWFPWLRPALLGHRPGFLAAFPFSSMHSRLCPFLLGTSFLGELFFSGLGNFYDLVSFWQAHVTLPEAGKKRCASVPGSLFRFCIAPGAPSTFARKFRSPRPNAPILGRTGRRVRSLISLSLGETPQKLFLLSPEFLQEVSCCLRHGDTGL